MQLPDVLTPVTPRQVADALARAQIIDHPSEAPLSLDALLVLVSHWALETGRGTSCHCFNLGNAKHVDGDGFDFTYYACDEIIDGKVVWFYPPAAGCCFRAWRTLDDAARAYLHMIRGRFGNAWGAVIAGDPALFCHILKLDRYYTADEAKYTRGVVALVEEFRSTFRMTPDLHTVKGQQHALNLLGFGPLVEDGDTGPMTLAAVRRFQKANGLVPDGIVGPLTTRELAVELQAKGKS